MSYFTSKTFWLGAAERAIKTFAQSLLAVLLAGTVVWGQDWAQAIGLAGTAALLSLLTSIADPGRADTAVATGSTKVLGAVVDDGETDPSLDEAPSIS